MARSTWTWLIVAGAVAGGVYAAVHFWPRTPPDARTAPTEDLAAYAASPEFAELDPNRQRVVLDQLRRRTDLNDRRRIREHLSADQRRQFRENMRDSFRQRVQDRAERFVAAETRAEKNRILDEVIDRVQEMRDRRPRGDGDQPRRGGGPRGGARGGARGGPTLDRIKKRVEHSTPEMRAFHQALIERMRQRGIDPPWRRRDRG